MGSRRRRRGHWIIMAVPYVWSVFLVPVVNEIHARPFGMPFLEFWMLLGVVVVSICVGIVYKLDNKISGGK